jgi:predicted site-specific integrase-resolvase
MAQWCELRGVSRWTAARLAKAGKLKITEMSPRLIGVREDHDREYLDSCVRNAG